MWDMGKLINAFGYATCMQIIAYVVPPISTDREDMLVFNGSVTGSYSVKAMS